LTKEQFIKRRIEFDARDSRNNMISMISLFGFLGAAFLLSYVVPAQYNWIFVSVLLAVLLPAAILPFFGMNQAQKAGLVCQSCGGGLLGVPGQLAVSTDACPHCGKYPFKPGREA
jgi:hypothetical protein